MFDLLKEPSEHDIAWQWVNTILPSDMSSPFGAALSTYTAALTIVATLLLGWHIIIGIVSSAYTGKVLGDKYHQIWAPLRIVLGLGLLVPVAGSFSSVHHLIKEVPARVGVNLGNAPWNVFVGKVAGDEVPIIAHSSGGVTLALDIIEHEVCLATRNATASVWLTQRRPPDYGGAESGWGILGSKRLLWDYGRDCGSFSFVIHDDRPAFGGARQFAVAEIVGKVRPLANQIGQHFAKHNYDISAAHAELAVIGGSLPRDLAQTIRDAGKAYDEHIAQAAKTDVSQIASEQRSRLVAAAAQDGWINAGAYWRGLAQISELTTALTSEKPERTEPRLADFAEAERRGGTRDAAAAALQGVRSMISGETARVALTADDFAAAGDESGSFLATIIGPFTRSLGEWIQQRGETTDPMGQLISDGHWMMGTAESVIAAAAVAMGASSTIAGKVFGADGAVGWLLDWTKWGIAVVWIVGAVHAYVLPALPFILVIVAASKWIGSILEATIAAPLWAFVWVRLDGEELMAAQQQTGLMILFNIMLRPVFAVLSLCAAYLLFDMVLGTLNQLWPTAFYGQTGGSVVGLSGIVISLVLKAFLIWTLAINLFSYIADMPDRMFAWVGSQAGNLNEKTDFTAAAVGGAALANRAPKIGMKPKAEGKPEPTAKPSGLSPAAAKAATPRVIEKE